MSFPRYPEYKDSGVKWLGSAPSSWRRARFKEVFREREERSIAGEEMLLSVSAYTGVTPRSEILEDGDHLSRAESLEGYKVCYPNDLVMNIMLAWNRGLGMSPLHGICSPAYSVFQVVDGSSPRYLHYLLRSDEYIRYFKAFSAGVIDSRLRLYPDAFGALSTYLPSPQEQEKIAGFLDHETAKIDALVAEQNLLITLLKEKRQAVISHAVTKGLDPSVPMKDSGVEWLGEVPAHWEVKQIRQITQILRGKFTHRPRNDPAFYDGDYPFIQTGDVTGAKRYITEFKQTLNDKGAAVSKEFPRGTLVMTIAANIGDVAVLDFPAYFPDSMVGLVPGSNVDLMFLFYLVKSMKQPLEMNATISTQMNLNAEQIGSLSACCPPIDQQRQIVLHLDAETQQLDELIDEAQVTTALLKERRSALISAAVTGQIDVRGLAPAQEQAA